MKVYRKKDRLPRGERQNLVNGPPIKWMTADRCRKGVKLFCGVVQKQMQQIEDEVILGYLNSKWGTR